MTKKQRAEQAKRLRAELTKVRCWMSGFSAGRSSPGHLSVSIPGEDSLRQTIIFLDEIAAEAAESAKK